MDSAPGACPAHARWKVASIVAARKVLFHNVMFLLLVSSFPADMSICMPDVVMLDGRRSWLRCVGAGAESVARSPIASFMAAISCIWSTMISCAMRRS